MYRYVFYGAAPYPRAEHDKRSAPCSVDHGAPTPQSGRRGTSWRTTKLLPSRA